MVKPFWRYGTRREGGKGSEGVGKRDGLMWFKDLGNHAYGEYSMAVIQANQLLEDQSQLVSGALSLMDSGALYGTFVGVYDGHGGPETSRFVNENLFDNIKRFATEEKQMSANVIKNAFLATETSFLSLVRKQWHCMPHLASVGTCCLTGVICDGLLYIANAGDSRAVLGRRERALRSTIAVQLSTEHNASYESVRQELRSSHPHDPQIVVMKHKVWRVKGVIQVSRSIGDAYLKRPEFNREPLLPKYRVAEPFLKPILKAEPTISVHKLHPDDQFLIFASDGLWEHLSNQDAVDIVQHYPRQGIAKRLVKAALREAAKKREMRYTDLKKIDRGVRRHFHDDITVIVVYLDRAMVNVNTPTSIKCGLGVGDEC